MSELTEHILPLYDVVSFDIFDTFLLRPVLVPSDLFLVIGGEEFWRERVAAERRAGPETGWRYGISEIYDRMPESMRGMKDAELAAERTRTVLNPAMLEVYRKAVALGKKVVFVSDMYLTEDELGGILAAKGITEYDGLYSSHTRGCGKSGGALFRVMLDEIGASPARAVHIGDNEHADIRGAFAAGMSAQYSPKIADVFFHENRMLDGFFRKCGGMDNSHMRLIFGALAIAYHLNKCRNGDDPWYRTGCTYTAPIYYSYTRWVLDQATKLGKTKLLLSLRDCHVVGKILDRISPGTQYRYIASGRSVAKALLDKGLQSDEGRACANYIRSAVTDPDSTLFVEGTSANLSAETAMRMALRRDVATVYLSRVGEHGVPQDTSYFSDKCFNWLYGPLEFLGGAPFNHYTGRIVDGEPEVCENKSCYDAYRNFGVRRRESAAANTAVLLHANGEYLTGDECDKLMRWLWDNTKLDIMDVAHFMSQYSSWDPEHNARDLVYWK